MALYSWQYEPYITRALHDMLHGNLARQSDLEQAPKEMRVFLDRMQETLREKGLEALRKLYIELKETDQPWIERLAVKELPADLPELPERRVRFRDDDVFENRPSRQWLIPSILPKEGIALVFGVSGCGKSFLTIAWSLCIGTGTPWLGREVIRGPVAYIASEGAFGIGPRMKAWKSFHQFAGKSAVQWFEEPLALQDPDTFNELLQAFENDFVQPPILIVIDTLSRCSGGAEENSNTDMAKIIAAADTLQQRYHCTVLIVHHAGKDNERGPRGASSLVGNSETVICVSQTEKGNRITCYKQKDAAKFDAFSLKFQVVQYGPDTDETSVILTASDDDDDQLVLRHSEATMLTLLKEAEEPLMYGAWVKAGMEADLKERTAKSAIAELLALKRIEKIGKEYHLASWLKEEDERKE